MSPDLDAVFAEFSKQVRARMEIGARTYGDKSLTAEPVTLLNEIQEELEDVCGWSVLLWWQLERLRTAMEQCGSGERR